MKNFLIWGVECEKLKFTKLSGIFYMSFENGTYHERNSHLYKFLAILTEPIIWQKIVAGFPYCFKLRVINTK